MCFLIYERGITAFTVHFTYNKYSSLPTENPEIDPGRSHLVIGTNDSVIILVYEIYITYK